MSDRRSPGAVAPESDPAGKIRVLHVLVIVLSAVIVGGAAGLLSWAGDASVPHAILTAGGGFAGTTALLLGIAHYARTP
jgi:hypothetical protein